MSEIKIKGTLYIEKDLCKGCQLCVSACPPSVLEMSKETNAQGYRFPKLMPGCTACKACQMVCPDFVIDVYKFAKPITEEQLMSSVEDGKKLEEVN